MIYRCSNCGRVIANIRKINDLDAKGKSITIEGTNLKIVCKCKRDNTIDLKPYMNKERK